jgi:hypothetical protein
VENCGGPGLRASLCRSSRRGPVLRSRRDGRLGGRIGSQLRGGLLTARPRHSFGVPVGDEAFLESQAQLIRQSTLFGASRHWTGRNSPAGARSVSTLTRRAAVAGRVPSSSAGCDILDLARQFRARPTWRGACLRCTARMGQGSAELARPIPRAAARKSVAPSGVVSRELAMRSGLDSVATSSRFALPESLSYGRRTCRWHDPAEDRPERRGLCRRRMSARSSACRSTGVWATTWRVTAQMSSPAACAFGLDRG